MNVIGPEETGADVKLFCHYAGSRIKIEVNTVMRGLIEPAELRPLVPSAADFFQAFCEIKTVSTAQLYGGKLCAALDRQHPRDLFDVALFFDGGGEIETTKRGLIYALLCSNRPLHELLSPNPNNQEQAFNNQFQGMAQIPFNYQDFEMTREKMLEKIIKGLSSADINFLVSFTEAAPDWTHFDFSEYPAIHWKLLNIRKFKKESRIKFNEQLKKLKDVLAS